MTSKMHALHTSPNFAKLVGSLRRVQAMHPLLRLRTLFVVATSKYDYVAHAVLLNPKAPATLQARVHPVYRQAMCLPKWTPTAFLQAPLSLGGAGSPNLEHRNVIHLICTYVLASWSRNILARAASEYLLDTVSPFNEGTLLRATAEQLGVEFHTPGTRVLDNGHVQQTGSLEPLHVIDAVYLVTGRAVGGPWGD